MLNAPPGAPASAPQVPPPGAPPAPAPQGASCAAHPDRAAAGVCSRCGAFACPECLQPAADGTPQCLACRGRASVVEPTPWEESEKLGLARSYYETVKRSLVEPLQFFERMRVDDAKGALSYYWITNALGLSVGHLWQAALIAAGISSFGKTPQLPADHPLQHYMQLSSSHGFNVALGLASIVFAPVALYLIAGVLHLSLLLFKGATNGFAATLRAVAYASGPTLLQVVPFCGGGIGQLWTLVLVVIGVWKTHRTSTGVAIGAVAVPLVLLACCGCFAVGLAVVASGMAIASAVGK
jgi:hypothetical protein